MKFSLLLISFLLTLPTPTSLSAKEDALTSYIIHTTVKPSPFMSQKEWYHLLIKDAMGEAKSALRNHEDQIFYTYDTVMMGFAATLTSTEAQLLSQMPGVVHVQDDGANFRLQTTRTPTFLGLNTFSNDFRNFDGDDKVIVGIIDTGIWPESMSFDDTGFSDIPSNWRGKCISGDHFNASSLCNKKLIGAKYFHSGALAKRLDFGNGSDYLSARDKSGHGTHTASTAVGSPVENASLFGFAKGTARGMAPKARLSVYKVCWMLPDRNESCSDSDIILAMEEAVKDGVHVLSVSLGSNNPPFDFVNNSIAFGAFGAVRNGVFVACAAGNSGPFQGSVLNTAPWIMTVGAGSVDRTFPASVATGNGEVFVGESLYANSSLVRTEMSSVVYMGKCFKLKTFPPVVKGKIVVCEDGTVADGMFVEKFGGIGIIAVIGPNIGETIEARSFTIPGDSIGFQNALKFLSYIHSTSNPTASLQFHFRTDVGVARAPRVVSFSSRGPNKEVHDLLKPDILAPGLNIVAAWPTEATLTQISTDARRSDFNILSGTSMACPHVAGIAALLLASHPEWTPAMIRSALMTTADVLDHDHLPIIVDENLKLATPLSFGAGHVNPIKARDPGLIYDLGEQDYLNLLCTMTFNKQDIEKLVQGAPFSCTKFEQGASDLNYPSFSVIFNTNTKERTLTRTMTKTFEFPEIYVAKVINQSPEKVAIVVEPTVLVFHEVNERHTYQVHFTNLIAENATDQVEFGYIIWENLKHTVKAPMVISWSAL